MSSYKNLLLSIENGILTITINREQKLNALNRDTISELKRAFDEAASSSTLRGVILTGAGEKAFVAGADISEFSSFTPEQAKALSKDGQEVFQSIENLSKPVVAVVNGFALGGGCELAMACHMRIAASNAKFGQPEVNLGLIPGYGGTQRLTQLIGKGRAFEYLMTADMMTADQALSFGLVNHVQPDKASAIQKAIEILTKIGAKAPIAIKHTITCVNDLFEPGINGYATEASLFGECFGTEDFKEGATAFMEKRPAKFVGK